MLAIFFNQRNRRELVLVIVKLIASWFGITLKNLGQEGLDNRMRKNFLSGVKYEEMLGYSRAVKVGNTLYVSGTAGFVGDRIASNTYAQARHAMKKIVKVQPLKTWLLWL
jgi:hypothetical protein